MSTANSAPVGQVGRDEARQVADRESSRQSRIDEEAREGALLVAAHVFAIEWVQSSAANAKDEALRAAAAFKLAWRERYGK